MGFFSIFRKKKTNTTPDPKCHAEIVIADFRENDYLGMAAEVGRRAKAAVKAKNYDDAWSLYHEQKSLYMQHAKRSGFTARQTLALDATVHEEMANILRLEEKHPDALVHIVYLVLTNIEQPTKRHQQKLQSYFNRCKFRKTTLSDAVKFVHGQTKPPEFTLAKKIVSEWVSRG